MTPADLQLIKHAQNELITLCGGIDRAKEVAGAARSTVGRWMDVGDPTLMSWPAAIRLQKHCRVPVVTAALAAVEGRTLSDPDQGADQQSCLMTANAMAFVAAGQMNIVFSESILDGKVTPNELSEIDNAAGALMRRLGDVRRACAANRADGGMSLVKGGAA